MRNHLKDFFSFLSVYHTDGGKEMSRPQPIQADAAHSHSTHQDIMTFEYALEVAP